MENLDKQREKTNALWRKFKNFAIKLLGELVRIRFRKSFHVIPGIRSGVSTVAEPRWIFFPAAFSEGWKCLRRVSAVFKLGSQAVQECLGTWVFRQNICRMKVARKMLADNVQHDAVLEKFVISGVCDDYHVHVRVNDYILTKHSIEFKAARAGFHPQLVAIAESTFNAFLMLGGGDFNPEFRDNLLTVPFTFL